MFQKFNPDTRWVAAGLLGALLLADLAFVVLLPERHTMTEVLSERASPAEIRGLEEGTREPLL